VNQLKGADNLLSDETFNGTPASDGLLLALSLFLPRYSGTTVALQARLSLALSASAPLHSPLSSYQLSTLHFRSYAFDRRSSPSSPRPPPSSSRAPSAPRRRRRLRFPDELRTIGGEFCYFCPSFFAPPSCARDGGQVPSCYLHPNDDEHNVIPVLANLHADKTLIL
jgi:hypothetical protein